MASTRKAALLLIDWINDFDFPGSEALIEAARPAAAKVAVLKERLKSSGLPCIYINDNFGRWRSSFSDVLAYCQKRSKGADVFASLHPQEDDYFVLKPRHSGFYGTPLRFLLESLEVDTLILTGVAGNICVLFTAHDAHVRGYSLIVGSDTLASNTAEETRFTLEQLQAVMDAEVLPSAEIETP